VKQILIVHLDTLSFVSCVCMNRSIVILNRLKNVFDFAWIDSHHVWIDSRLNLINSFWVVSSNSLTPSESIHCYLESIQTSIWATWIVSYTSFASIFIQFPSSAFCLSIVWIDSMGKCVGTKGVSQNHLLSFDDNKVLKIINWIC